MILYNLHTLLLLIVIVPLVYLSSYISPEYSGFGHPVFLGIVLFTSSISAGVGMKPKLYFIPVWLFFTVVLILRTFYKFGVTYGVYSVLFSIGAIFIGYMLKKRLVKKNWQKAQLALKDFTIYKKKVDPKIVVYYPDYLYTDLPIYDKYLEPMFIMLQKKWYNKKEVKTHYYELIEELNKRNNTDEGINQTAYFKNLLDNNAKDGIYKFSLENLAKNKGFL